MDVVAPQYRSINVEPYSNAEILYKFRPTHNINYKIYLYYLVEHAGNVYPKSTICNAEAKHVPEGLYDFANNLWEKDLLDALSGYLKNHNSLTYRQARELLWTSFDNYENIVECVYTGKTVEIIGVPDFAELDKNGFNTEHTWPRSYGSDTEPPLSDMYHIFPSDKTANDRRANFPYGYVTGSISWQNGGSKLGINEEGKVVFEPREVFKGNVARAILYFAVRYDNPFNFLNSQDEVLREWAIKYQPDERERRRNDSIASYQLRRNVFIDHPEFIERINSISGDNHFSNNHELIGIGEGLEYRININHMTDAFPISFNIHNNGFNSFEIDHVNLKYLWNLNGLVTFKSNSDFTVPDKRIGNYSLDITINKPNELIHKEDTIFVNIGSKIGQIFSWYIILFDDPTSVNSWDQQRDIFDIFPNPARNFIKVCTEFPVENIENIEISNIQGQIIDKSNYSVNILDSNLLIFDVSKLKIFGNVFIISLAGRNFQTIGKFIISN
jgi:endonuclease I